MGGRGGSGGLGSCRLIHVSVRFFEKIFFFFFICTLLENGSDYNNNSNYDNDNDNSCKEDKQLGDYYPPRPGKMAK